MAKIDLNLIQKLRERTGAGMMDAKKALEQADGDMNQAIEILRKKGAATAEKRSSHATAEGIVHCYIHPGARLGVMVEIDCETDFVARTQEFKQFANDIAMHIAATHPQCVSPEELSPEFVKKEQAKIIEELADAKKPAAVIEQIAQGKLKKIYSAICLLQQPFVKNDQMTVEQILQELIARLGENIKIKRFARFEVGQTHE